MLGAAILITGADNSASVPRTQTTGDSGEIRVHLLGTDRGGRGPLASTLRFLRGFEPLHLHTIGRTYRFVNIAADVVVEGKASSPRRSARRTKGRSD